MSKLSKRMIITTLLLVILFNMSVFAEEDKYLLGPGDVIQISVWKNPEFNGQMPIRIDGYISLPQIGEIKAEGLTPEGLAQKIESLLSTYLVSPQVTVMVTEFKKIEVSVMGAVVKQGVFPVKPGTKLLEVLAMAGLQKESADLEGVTLSRNETHLNINVDVLLRQGGHQNYELREGDVIFIPSSSRTAFILGEVKKPGGYPVDKKTTPADLLAMAGGPTDRANLKSVKIIRRDGLNQIETINLEDFLASKDQESILYLETGDIVQIEEVKSINWEKIFTYAAGIKVIHDLIVNW